jgi:predicted enzyme related to lactoylglutathione lyase
MPNPVTHFEIIGKDAKKLQSFYAQLFGWKVDANNPMDYGMVEAQDGKGAGGGISAAPDGQASYVTVYVEVDDPQAYLDKAVSLGGKVIMPVTTIPDTVTLAQFADPEGHLIGITASEMPGH